MRISSRNSIQALNIELSRYKYLLLKNERLERLIKLVGLSLYDTLDLKLVQHSLAAAGWHT